MPSAFTYEAGVVGFMSRSSGPPFPKNLAAATLQGIADVVPVLPAHLGFREDRSSRPDGQGCARGAGASAKAKSMRLCCDKMEARSITF